MNHIENNEYDWCVFPLEKWEPIFNLITKIENTESFGETHFLEKMPNGILTFPYTKSAEVVKEFNDQVYRLRLLIDFEWHRWLKGTEILNDKNSDYDALSLDTLLRLITVMIRADRFHDGYLVKCFEEGIVLKILSALQPKVLVYYKVHLSEKL